MDLSASEVAVPPSGNAVSEVIASVQSLAESVGPEWGLALLVVILVFLPKYGVLVHLASLLKEDRADARKQRVEIERLESRYRNRGAPPQKLPPPKGQKEKDQIK